MIVLLPGILAWWTAASQSLESALIGVYLPVLMLIPDNFSLPIDGLPDPNFSQCAILPIGLAVCWKAVFRREWKFSVLDFFVFAYVAWQFISDFYNVGYGDAQNLSFDVVTLCLLPYVCGKALIEATGSRTQFARRFVWLLFVVSLLSVYEFKMGISLFRPAIGRFFPGQTSGWYTQIRWGFGRIAGPYGHAILMGSILAAGFLLCRWLSRSGQWERQFRWLGEVPLTKSQVITGGLLAATVMTLSRGPWLGAACGMALASLGTSADRPRTLKRVTLLLVVGGVLVYSGGKAYISNPQSNNSASLAPPSNAEEVQSAAYRAVLLVQYTTIAMERPVWGWGRAHWPRIPGMSSIDNNYLYIALNCGFVGTGLFVAILLAASARLFVTGFFDEGMAQEERAFRFTLLGVIAAIAISTATVFLGSQLYPLLYLFLGWADACVLAKKAQAEDCPSPVTVEFQMMRVVA
jgi:hypothetical protein